MEGMCKLILSKNPPTRKKFRILMCVNLKLTMPFSQFVSVRQFKVNYGFFPFHFGLVELFINQLAKQARRFDGGP